MLNRVTRRPLLPGHVRADVRNRLGFCFQTCNIAEVSSFSQTHIWSPYVKNDAILLDIFWIPDERSAIITLVVVLPAVETHSM